MNPSINDYSVKNSNYLSAPDLSGLLTLPRKNVESRIKGLEFEIKARQQLSDQALTALSTHSVQLKEHVRQAHYLGAFDEHRDFTKQVVKLEEVVLHEMTSCFSDVSKLKEKLQEAKEELEIEKQKLKLAITDSYKLQPTTPVTPSPKTNYQFLPQKLGQYLPKYSVFN